MYPDTRRSACELSLVPIQCHDGVKPLYTRVSIVNTKAHGTAFRDLGFLDMAILDQINIAMLPIEVDCQDLLRFSPCSRTRPGPGPCLAGS